MKTSRRTKQKSRKTLKQHQSQNGKIYLEVPISQKTGTSKPTIRSTQLTVKKLIDYILNFKSRSSVGDYLSGIWRFCNFVKMDPDKIVNLDAQLIKKEMDSFYQEMKNRGYSLLYARKILHQVKTFMRCNGIKLEYACPRIPARYRHRKVYIPTAIEAKKMMDNAGNLRNSTIIGILSFGGVRNATARALQFGVCYDPNLKNYTVKCQLERGVKVLAIIVSPEMKKIVENACKGSTPYFTFVPDFVVEKMKAYLNQRIQEFGPIGDDEMLFPTMARKVPKERRSFTPLSNKQFQNIVRDAARNAGIPDWDLVTPHCLRKTFRMWLMDQPDAVRLPLEDREFLMGHVLSGTMDPYYDKSRVEELREKFSKLVLSECDYNRSILQAMCTMLGIDFNVEYSELTKKLGREPSLSEMSEIIKQKLRPKQIIVRIGDVAKYLNEGWRWVGKYDDKNAIIEK